MKYLYTGADIPVPELDVYQDPDEEPTIPKPVETSVGRELALAIIDFESRGQKYDIDELLVAIRRKRAA
jgi:hypothetical protein